MRTLMLDNRLAPFYKDSARVKPEMYSNKSHP